MCWFLLAAALSLQLLIQTSRRATVTRRSTGRPLGVGPKWFAICSRCRLRPSRCLIQLGTRPWRQPLATQAGTTAPALLSCLRPPTLWHLCQPANADDAARAAAEAARVADAARVASATDALLLAELDAEEAAKPAQKAQGWPLKRSQRCVCAVRGTGERPTALQIR